ncbi:MAG TPA: CdaR family protein [Anaerolineaceae bacterium]|nr:CdaR family protein [Anaerolineaceae bacterium]
MLAQLRKFIKLFPTFLLALVLALAVWISAITAADPVEQRLYPSNIEIEVIGQDPALVITSPAPGQAAVTLSAPRSVLDRLLNEASPVRAVIDLSGLGPGTHSVPVQIQVSIRPVRVASFTPRSITVVMEPLASYILPINLIRRGEPAIGFQASEPELNATSVTVSGPQSLVEQVAEVRATLDINLVQAKIVRTLSLQALDAKGAIVNGVSLTPDQVQVTQDITQRGGYRTVVVKVVVSGQIPTGYRLTNISVSPLAVTVFSTDPQLVNDLPGFIETETLDLTGARDDLDLRLNLNLPEGVSVVGDPTVLVQVGIAAIEGSVTMTNIPIEVIGLDPNLEIKISPERVDVILSGPLPLLDMLRSGDIRVTIDVTGVIAGTYQRTPLVTINFMELQVQSILPESVEVILSPLTTPTPTVTPTRTPRP